MKKDAKSYMSAVVATISKKYHVPETEVCKMVEDSFVYDSLEHYPDETLHDDIETNADLVYHDAFPNQMLKCEGSL